MGAQSIKTRRFYSMLFYAAILGMVSGIVTFLFIEVVHIGQQLVWEKFAPSTGISPPVFTLVICLTGGLVVGLLLQLTGRLFSNFCRDHGRVCKNRQNQL